ncbi:unnamed protein product [Paramecium primaurelia]|uniref:Uncharacterized protein n=1 Tax=Paramecium primaurelia TaxID=5886 RepID=A0A8S1KAU6_PARPR|nr:unnamed protein product [Paramecium primaurelia]
MDSDQEIKRKIRSHSVERGMNLLQFQGKQKVSHSLQMKLKMIKQSQLEFVVWLKSLNQKKCKKF